MATSAEYWFGWERVIYALSSKYTEDFIGLPKREAVRGLKYFRDLLGCKTYGDAQSLYRKFASDPEAPKLIPRIQDIEKSQEFLIESWYAKQSLPNDQNMEFLTDVDPTTEEMFLCIESSEFIWDMAEPYLDDNGIFSACRDVEIWTDAWIPLEIAKTCGVPDKRYGIDYNNAELIYPEPSKVIREFEKFGFSVVLDHPDFIELVVFE